MTGLVSVVIPVRNGARYLGEAIKSVLGQEQIDVEVIVVDNGSSDGSGALAESFGAPVRVVGEGRLGAANARNAGVRLARGEYLAFLDADDVWASGKLNRQVRELEARKDLDMVFTFGENFLSPELTEAQGREVSYKAEIGPFIIPSTMLARRESFVRVGEIPELREGEFIAWYGLAVSLGLRSEIIPEALFRRRVHLSNSTRIDAHRADLLRAAKMVLDRKKGF
ncbi:MAG: glycosyltransferase family A protein [Terracidiphilus sp.]|jgi:glycosyltransferase involved in cell wall biosynthesis